MAKSPRDSFSTRLGARCRARSAVGTWGQNGELEGPRGFKLGPRTFPSIPRQFRDILKKSIFWPQNGPKMAKSPRDSFLTRLGARCRARSAVGTWGQNEELEGPRSFTLGRRTFPSIPHPFRDILKKNPFFCPKVAPKWPSPQGTLF